MLPPPHKILILFFLLFAAKISAQTPSARFQHIGLEEGLSQNAVMDITQDSIGFLWIATRDGLNRYNGYEVKVYRNDYEDSTSISSNIIRKLFVDSKGRLWITAENGGLTLYNKQEDNFQSVLNSINKKPFTITSNIVEDDKGMLWFGVDKIGLIKFNPENYSYENFQLFEDKRKSVFYCVEKISQEIWITTRENGLVMFNLEKEEIALKTIDIEGHLGLSNETRVVKKGKDGLILVGTLHGIFKYNHANSHFEYFTMQGWDPRYAEVSNMLIRDSTVWFASKANGLFRFDLKSKNLRLYTSNITSKYALSHSFVTSIYQDRQRNIWVGTYGGGVNKMNIDIPFKLYTHDKNDPFSLANSSSRKILKDKDGNLVVASYNGVRVFSNNTKTAFDLPYLKNIEYNKEKLGNISMLSRAIHSLLWENEDELWVGHEGNGVQLYNFKTQRYKNYKLESENSINFKSNFIVDLEKDQNGTVWAATLDGIYYKDSLEKDFKLYSLNKEQEPEILNIYAHPKGVKFVASQIGLHYINGEQNQLINCNTISKDSSNCKINSRLTFVNPLNDSVMIIGSTGNGLIEFKYDLNGDELKVKGFSVIDNDAIKNQTVYAILNQNDSIVWFSSNNGLFKYNYFSKEVFNYTFMDGLQDNEFNYDCYYHADDGTMFFGGISGINKFKPEEVKLEKQEVNLYFNSIQFGDSIITNLYSKPDLASISIHESNDYVDVKYFGINLDRPNSINYFVQLVGVDEKPVFVGQQREINFFNLSPGPYELRVWAANLNALSPNNKYESLHFFIKPPFYLTMWFKSIAILLIVFSLIILVRLRMRGLLKQKEKLEKEIQLSQKEIENQKLESEIATSRAVIRGQNLEQKRISEELHDGIGHLLTAASLNVSAIKAYIDKGLWDKLPDEINNVSEILNQSIGEVRNISHNLMPNLLIEEGLESAISEFTRRIQRSSNIDIEFKSKNLSEDIPMETAVSIFRMIQETVNNSLRHADASKISIVVRQLDGSISIDIKDNGIGFDQKSMKNSTGQGLKNLQARTELNRGEFNITSQVNEGTEVNINIPIT